MKYLVLSLALILSFHSKAQVSHEKRPNVQFGIPCSQQNFDSLFSRSFYLLYNLDSADWTVQDCINMVRVFNTIHFAHLPRCEGRKQIYLEYIRKFDDWRDYIWLRIEPSHRKYIPILYYYSKKYDLLVGDRPERNSMFFVYDWDGCP
ncbi:MAG: hypothetical protein ACKVTZ_10145 [Bacteroidia bacterium]